jgi:hypothetical protein
MVRRSLLGCRTLVVALMADPRVIVRTHIGDTYPSGLPTLAALFIFECLPQPPCLTYLASIAPFTYNREVIRRQHRFKPPFLSTMPTSTCHIVKLDISDKSAISAGYIPLLSHSVFLLGVNLDLFCPVPLFSGNTRPLDEICSLVVPDICGAYSNVSLTACPPLAGATSASNNPMS